MSLDGILDITKSEQDMKVEELLSQNEPIPLDDFRKLVINQTNMDRYEVHRSLKTLMQLNEARFNLEYELETE